MWKILGTNTTYSLYSGNHGLHLVVNDFNSFASCRSSLQPSNCESTVKMRIFEVWTRKHCEDENLRKCGQADIVTYMWKLKLSSSDSSFTLLGVEERMHLSWKHFPQVAITETSPGLTLRKKPVAHFSSSPNKRCTRSFWDIPAWEKGWFYHYEYSHFGTIPSFWRGFLHFSHTQEGIVPRGNKLPLWCFLACKPFRLILSGSKEFAWSRSSPPGLSIQGSINMRFCEELQCGPAYIVVYWMWEAKVTWILHLTCTHPQVAILDTYKPHNAANVDVNF